MLPNEGGGMEFFMAREAILEINCSRYSERIMDVINLLNELGWKYYDIEKNIEYLPLGDDDDFDWKKILFQKINYKN